jgi:hypothetical protein
MKENLRPSLNLREIHSKNKATPSPPQETFAPQIQEQPQTEKPNAKKSAAVPESAGNSLQQQSPP